MGIERQDKMPSHDTKLEQQSATSNNKPDVDAKDSNDDSSSKTSDAKREESVSETKSIQKTETETATMTTRVVFDLAREFFRAKDGTKAAQMSYDERNMANVLCRQAKHGKYEPEVGQQVGFLDLVGKDRLQLWKSIGDISKEEAMTRYIDIIGKACPLFHAHFEAHKRQHEEKEKERKRLIDEEEKRRREMAEQKEKKLRDEDIKLL